MSDSSDVPTLSEHAEQVAIDILGRVREEIARADQKAALLLAAVGVIAGALVSGAISGRWTPFAIDNSIEWLWWLGLLTSILGVYLLAFAVYPRVRPARSDWSSGIAFFGDVVDHGRSSLELRLQETAGNISLVTDQLYQNSRIADAKYWGIRNALRCFAGATLLCGASLIVDGFIR